MSDRSPRYGMILLDAAPAILRVHGQPMLFGSADETLEYARLHGVARWMVTAIPRARGPSTPRRGRSTRPRHPGSGSTSTCTGEPHGRATLGGVAH